MSPLSRKQSFVFVARVGAIFVDLIVTPLTVTPAGTVKGNISSNLPGPIRTVSPNVACAKAYLTVLNATFLVLPGFFLYPADVGSVSIESTP